MKAQFYQLVRLTSAVVIMTLVSPGMVLGQSGATSVTSTLSISTSPNGTGFTYQGLLRKNGTSVNAICSFTLSLYDAATGGAQIGPQVISSTVQVSNGLFTIVLDFGPSALNGEARWLESKVLCPGDGLPVTLSPRTALFPAPYAHALPGMRTPRGNNDANGDPTVNVIGGTATNIVTVDSFLSMIGGGSHNRIGSDSGGSTIAGGNTHVITDVSYNSVIGGGYSNAITGRSAGATLAGGISNIITGNSDESTLGGGAANRLDGNSSWSVIAGGNGNFVTGTSQLSTLGGGWVNSINGSWGAVIAGGVKNIVVSGIQSTLSGGYSNTLVTSNLGTISGGQFQVITGSAYSTIGGGLSNNVEKSQYGVIAGGWDNRIGASPYAAAIIGGISNTIRSSSYGVVGGGFHNQVLSGSDFTVIGGGSNNSAVQTSTLSFIGGGDINTIVNLSYKSVIGGGEFNTIRDGSAYSTIGGGWVNQIADGSQWSFIGGGHANIITATALYASIPGGENNAVRGDYALAAGRRAQALHNGTFVWGDSTNADIASTKADQFVIRATGGMSLSVNAGNGGTHPFGERYRDNAIQAWAVVAANGSLYASYGVSGVTHSTGIYTFTLQVGAIDNTRLVPVVTPEIDTPPTSASAARLTSVNTISGTTFTVYITNGSYVLTDNDFLMIMTGR